METISQKNIRAQNILQVCESIFDQKPLSRYEVSQKTGLSLMTVGKVIELLKQKDIVYEVKDISSSVGRKAGKIYIQTEGWFVALIDLCQEEIVCSLMLIAGDKAETLLHYPLTADADYKMQLEIALTRFRESLTGRLEQLCGIAALVPGPYHADKDIIINRRIPQLNRVPIGQTLSGCFDGFPIQIEEDVKFAARYAMRHVAGYENKTVFYAYIGDGVGGAILQNAESYRSAYSYSADFGQFKLPGGSTVESKISLKRFRDKFPAVWSGEKINDKEQGQLCLYIQQTIQIIVQCLDSVMWLLDPDEIIFDSEYSQLVPGFFASLSEEFLKRAAEERGEYVPHLSCFQSEKNALYMGARNSVRERFFQGLA